MKKMICILALLLALVCVFVACDENTETPNTGGNNENIEQNDGNTGNDPSEQSHTHSYGEWKVTIVATCGAKGEEKRSCACGETETRELAMLSHSFGEWSISKAATCAEKGEEKRTCACGESETREISFAATHAYGTDNRCTLCGSLLQYTEGLVYELTEDNNGYIVVNSGTVMSGDVIIPPYHLGKPVVGFADEAFDEGYPFTSIAIPYTVTRIERDAFAGCAAQSIIIPDSVTVIEDWAFAECRAMSSITIPASVTSIGEGAFCECFALMSIVFEEGSNLTSIGEYAFVSCTALVSIAIPASITSIGRSAFDGCNNLTSAIFETSHGWMCVPSLSEDLSIVKSISATDLANPATAAEYLKSTYHGYWWNRTVE